MHALQAQVLHRQRLFDDGQRLAGLQRDAELAVDLSGADKIVGVGVDAGLNPEGDVGALAHLAGKAVQPLQLIVVVDDHQPHILPQGVQQFAVGLVVAVEADLLGRESGGQSGVQLSLRHDVQPHALIVHDPADLLAAEGLAGVADHSPAAVKAVDRVAVASARRAHPGLIQHIQRGAVLPGKLHRVAPADGQVPLRVYL